MFGMMYELDVNIQKHRFYLAVDRYLFPDFEFSLYRYQYTKSKASCRKPSKHQITKY
jgi:hypothetical protein